jgi:uncharacterized protein (DUF302 family)
MFFAGFITGIIVFIFIMILLVPKIMFLINESKLDFDETVKKVVEQTAENKWSMPYQYDLQATMKKNGYDVLPVTVFSICQPQHASKILSSNEERFVSALMPCRIAIYKKEDGKTYVSRLNAGLISKLLSKKVRKIMGDVAVESEIILEPVIKK